MEGRTSKNRPIRVDSIPDDVISLPEGSGTFGMTLAPGVKDWNWDRDMKTDMRHLREHWKIAVLVSLIEEHEYELYKMEGYAREAEAAVIAVEEFPIVDVDVPREEQVEEYADLVGRIVGFLREGRNTVVHCRGGIGHDADDAMRLASDASTAEVPETEGRKEYVREFARRYKGRWSR